MHSPAEFADPLQSVSDVAKYGQTGRFLSVPAKIFVRMLPGELTLIHDKGRPR